MRYRVNWGWTNPVAALAISRRVRSRGFKALVAAPALFGGAAAVACYHWRDGILQRLGRAVPEWFASPGPGPVWYPSPGPGEVFLFPLLLTALLFLAILAIVPQATLGIAREREQRTLEPLLITPMKAEAILWGELAGVLVTPLLAVVAVLPLAGLSYSMGSIGMGSIVGAVFFLALCVVFFGTASLCASCWCRRSAVAMVLGYLWVLLFLGATYLVWFWLRRPGGMHPVWIEGALALNPAAALLDCVVPRRGLVFGEAVVSRAGMAAVVYSLMGVFFFALGALGLRRR